MVTNGWDGVLYWEIYSKITEWVAVARYGI
jgi:hypothetical protein